MSSPSADVRNNISDDRIRLDDRTSRLANFETTRDGDVVIVQPSFDDDNSNTTHKSPSNTPLKPRQEWQARSPQQEKATQLDSSEARSPSSPPTRGHSRNLSAVFFDATSLGRRGSGDSADMYKDEEESRKHRRMTSNGTSNPNVAHRRLDSIGQAAAVSRTKHRREASLGLDMLSHAAAEASQEDLALAAGKQQPAPKPEFVTPTVPPPRTYGEAPLYHSAAPPTHMFPPPQNRPYPGGPPPPPHYPPPPQGGPHYPSQAYSNVPRHASSYYPPYPHGAAFPSQQPYPVQHSMYPPPSKAAVYPPEARRPVENPDAVPSEKEWNSTNNAGANHQGSQTFVTAMAVGGNRTLRPSNYQRNTATNTDAGIPKQIGSHHRRLSSFSTLGLSTIFCNPVSAPDTDHPLKSKKKEKHHRTTSSSVSFLNVLDYEGMDDNASDTFLRHLHGSAEASYPVSATSSSSAPNSSTTTAGSTTKQGEKPQNKLAAGGTSKRVRRKCTIEGCPNRVVQGGLCISHGAKRKTCKHPGCTKNVKKAGFCSTHGPARKRCEHPDCPKVAVQGGRCIAHGAKKKLCSFEDCSKQAILGGMCKKHHDAQKGPATTAAAHTKPARAAVHRPTHTRGLSIFHDMSADAVHSLINAETVASESPPERPPPRNSW